MGRSLSKGPYIDPKLMEKIASSDAKDEKRKVIGPGRAVPRSSPRWSA